jgi:hypothetical protein
MAIPGITQSPAALALFERLPDKLFSPLGSTNRHVYWSLLCELHKRRFGPDAPLPPSYGYLLRDIHKVIEEHITYGFQWIDEGEDSSETPLNIRAIGLFNHLLDCGWFKTERYGMEKTVTMRPAVSQFLFLLIKFAETGPIFLSGKIRSIDANLRLIVNGEASGDVLQEAAEQARNLLEHIRNTGTNVRDLMASMGAEISTSQYVRKFFTDYVEQVFIGDYRELRTSEHPLSRRPQILRTVEHLSSSESDRSRLIAWYEQRPAAGNRTKAEWLFERDLQRLNELQKIDEYLERLDDEIRRANKRALAFLDYRLRSIRPVDHLIRHSIERLLRCEGTVEAGIFPPNALMSGDRLAEPRCIGERPQPTPLRRVVVSDQERARSRLMQRAREARTVTPPKLASFVSAHLDGQRQIQTKDLTLQSVQDVCVYQTLQSLAMATDSGSRRLILSSKTMARGFVVRSTDPTENEHPLLTGRNLIIETQGRQPDTRKE